MAKVQINQEDLLQHAQELNSNMEYFESIGRPLLEEYSKDLDEKVGAVKAYLDQLSDEFRDTYFLARFGFPSSQGGVISLRSSILIIASASSTETFL